MNESGDCQGGTIIAQHAPMIATTTSSAASGRGIDLGAARPAATSGRRRTGVTEAGRLARGRTVVDT